MEEATLSFILNVAAGVVSALLVNWWQKRKRKK